MRTKYLLLFSILLTFATTGFAQAGPLVSHFPKNDLGGFLAEKFDLASIRSSFGPRRSPGQRTFSDFGMKPSKAGDDFVEYESADWFYGLRIARRGDVNGDGIEDLEVCFVDRALGSATYAGQESLLVTRYAEDGYAVALSFTVDACGKPSGTTLPEMAAAAGQDGDGISLWDGMPLPDSCGKNTITVNACAHTIWKKADEHLNALYQAQLQYLHEMEATSPPGRGASKNLIASQRAWIAFRDRDCAYRQGEPGHSGNAFENLKCMYKHTLQRAAELQEYVSCRYNGCPE